MAAPQGNKFWELRSKHGRSPIFQTPIELWAACCEYFEWVEENPLHEDKIIAYEGIATHVDVAKMRAMTLNGLCVFLDIDRKTWDHYRAREGFESVCGKVDAVIREQKFTGAAAGLLNPVIIARELGLAEKQEVTGANGGPIETRELSDTEAARRIAFTLAKATKET